VKAIEVECPRCGALRGDRCRTERTCKFTDAHRARIDRAFAVARERTQQELADRRARRQASMADAGGEPS
jgi:hypothetical protein